jgi:hypothetical protein
VQHFFVFGSERCELLLFGEVDLLRAVGEWGQLLGCFPQHVEFVFHSEEVSLQPLTFIVLLLVGQAETLLQAGHLLVQQFVLFLYLDHAQFLYYCNNT